MVFVYVLIRHVGRHSTKNKKEEQNNTYVLIQYNSLTELGVYIKKETLNCRCIPDDRCSLLKHQSLQTMQAMYKNPSNTIHCNPPNSDKINF